MYYICMFLFFPGIYGYRTVGVRKFVVMIQIGVGTFWAFCFCSDPISGGTNSSSRRAVGRTAVCDPMVV